MKDKIIAAANTAEDKFLFEDFVFGKPFENELLFFFKPECFKAQTTSEIVQMVCNKFADFKVEVSGGILMKGIELERREIMDRHYGFINTLSRKASELLTSKEKDAMKDALEVEESAQPIFIGGHEFLKINGKYNHSSLDKLWATKKSLRLRSGFYFQRYDIEGIDYILINGFHPQQLSHFTNKDHQIIVLLLHSNLSWQKLKADLVGNTFPEKASSESIRGSLYKKRGDWNLSDVSIANNFVHLSAGPFEAFFEIKNFLQDIGIPGYDLTQTSVGKKILEKGLDRSYIDLALQNPMITKDNKDLFSITEDTDSTEALEVFSQNI